MFNGDEYGRERHRTDDIYNVGGSKKIAMDSKNKLPIADDFTIGEDSINQIDIYNNNNAENVSSSLSINDALLIKELRLRLRNILTYSCLILVFFLSPVVLISLFYGVRAKRELNKHNYVLVHNHLTRAHYLNLMAFVVGSIIYATYFVVSVLIIKHYKFN